MSAGSYADFLWAVGQKESGNNYSVVASAGYLGRFQFDEGALQEIGFYNKDSTSAIDFIGSWTAKAAGYGVASKADFLASHAAQDAAINDYFAFIDQDLAKQNLDVYEGQTVGGVLITKSGLLAGSLLVGSLGLKSFLTSGGANDTLDYYGTPVSQYLRNFGDYDTPFGANAAPAASAPTSGDDNLTAGAAAAEIHSGAGADTISAAGYSGHTYLRGDDGADSVQGGSGFDDINGNVGADTIDGGLGGDDWLVGGKDNDRIVAHASTNILYGNLGADTLSGGTGADTMRGGQGDDVLIGGSGAGWLSGDRGSDTVTGGQGADIFHSFGEAGLDRITDFNRAEGDRVQLDPGSTYAVAQSGADTVISIGGGAQMVLVGVQMSTLAGDWIFVG